MKRASFCQPADNDFLFPSFFYHSQYIRPTDVVGAAAMQGWADGLSVPPEQKAYQRQFAGCKQPERTMESMSRTENVATLLQPDLYHVASQVDRVPLFTR